MDRSEVAIYDINEAGIGTDLTNAHHRMHRFPTGAIRESDHNKLDFEGFLSPLVLERYAQYMAKHQAQADGNVRASDNWQRGIPLNVYVKSLWRHFMDLWFLHRGHSRTELWNGQTLPLDRTEACCAILFNVMGYLHELLKETVDESA